MLEGIAGWLSRTPLSALFADTHHLATWLIIPASEIVHIVCVGIVVVCGGLLNLRLLGLMANEVPFARLATRLLPWIWAALTVLFLTGVIVTVAEPGRELLNISFRTKMVMLLLAVAITLIYEGAIMRVPMYWENTPEHRRVARLLACASLILWIGIVAAGRLIAYTA